MSSMSDSLAGKRILMLPKYSENGASSRLRSLEYIPWLQQAGADVDVQSFFGTDYVKRLYAGHEKGLLDAAGPYARRIGAMLRARRYDLLWIEKELFPWAPGLIESLAPLCAVPYLVDYDDAIFHNYDMHSSAMVKTLLGNKLDTLLRSAAAVTPGNAYLESYALAHGAKRTEIFPTVIDLQRYPMCAPPGGTRIRIGWIGTPGTVKYLRDILPELAAVAAQYPLTLVTIGAPKIEKTAPLEIEQHDWSEAEEAQLLTSTDIGIMPLPDEPFERGKCGYKLIQYMACGRAVIASPVGVNNVIVSPDTGILARSGTEWRDALGRLCQDAGLRRNMGQAGRAKIEAEYCIQVTAPRMIKLMAQAMAS